MLRKLAILALCCTFTAAAALAQQDNTVVQSSGRFTINGRAATDSSVLLPGDVVETSADPAVIIAKGLVLNLGPNSTVRYQAPRIEFSRGSVVAATSAPQWQVAVGQAAIVATSATAKVEVTERENLALIKLLEGAASLQEGTQVTALQPGFTVARPLPTAPEVAKARKPASKAPIIAAAAGGGIAAVIFAARGKGGESRTPSSPAAP
jgi:hypothetical protein